MYTDQPLPVAPPKKSSKRQPEIEIVQNGTCLMIEFPKFNIFTHKRNFKCLIEICKKVKAPVAVVRVEEAQLASLKEIADSLNKESAPTSEIKYTTLRYRLTFSEASEIPRKQRINEIKQLVRNEILKSDTVSTVSLATVLGKYDLKKSQLQYYLRSVKKTMELEGYSFQ